MSYAALMAHMEVGRSNAAVLSTAGHLAEAFGAAITGVAICQPMQIVYGDGFASGYVIEEDRSQIEEDLQVAEREFRESYASRIDRLDWRGAETFLPLASEVAIQARDVDLIITSAEREPNPMARWRRAKLSDLVMAAGRPILIVPQALGHFRMNEIVLAWKDGPECRRAASNALPLFERARKVTVVECATSGEADAARARLEDVQTWLRRHRVMADIRVATTDPGSRQDAAVLVEACLDRGADLVVAGAYGHSRLREWALGGVTRDLLMRGDRCVFLSR
jgi:nucleotide-binding universal stress UspA family protein